MAVVGYLLLVVSYWAIGDNYRDLAVSYWAIGDNYRDLAVSYWVIGDSWKLAVSYSATADNN
jgi:hypothetical protein